MSENIPPNRLQPNQPGRSNGSTPLRATTDLSSSQGSGQQLTSPPGLLWSTKTPVPRYSGAYPAEIELFTAGKHAKLFQNSSIVFNDLLGILRRFLHMVRRKSISFFRVGFEIQDAYLAAVVTVAPDVLSIIKAKEVADAMKASLLHRGLADIEVAFLCARYYPSVPPQPASSQFLTIEESLVDESPPSRYSKVGTSLGYGGDYSGTLGCFVTIDGKNKGTYALTTAHVALPEQWISAPVARNSPPTFNIADNPRDIHLINQPSRRDIGILIPHLEMELQGLKKIWQDNEAGIDKNRSHSRRDLNTSEHAILNACRTNFEDAEKVLAKVRNWNPGFGRVAFTSGRRFEYPFQQNAGFTMDWALISLDRARFDLNPVENEFLPFKLSFDQESAWNRANPGAPILRGFRPELSGTWDLMHELQKGAEDIYVLKRGRTTGYTAGQVNEYVSVTLETAVDEEELMTTELAINNVGKDIKFSQKGDSGSIVFDRSGFIVGLLHGGQYMGKHGDDWSAVTYMTPIDLVFQHIKELTGASKVTIN